MKNDTLLTESDKEKINNIIEEIKNELLDFHKFTFKENQVSYRVGVPSPIESCKIEIVNKEGIKNDESI